MPTRRGTCYGFEIRSRLDFHYLRGGTGAPLELGEARPPEGELGELLRTWDPPAFPVRVRLYGEDGRYRIFNGDAGWFTVDPEGGRLGVPVHGDPVRREERTWGFPTMLCFLARGDLALHASSIQVDGSALVLAAPRRFGKTTLAAAFAAAGHRVLAEDLTCIRPGPQPAVVPGPAMLRLRRDVADRLLVPGSTEVGRDEERIHLSLDVGRGTCDPVPVGGIALLLEGDGEPTLEPAHPTDVVRDLWALSFKLPTDADRSRCFHAVSRVASAVPVWHLTRRLRLDALGPTMERLREAMDRKG